MAAAITLARAGISPTVLEATDRPWSSHSPNS
ncbi:hypothetical protein [Mycobacteroides immunogenum]|nr:hypothetical protein [Mycobacteroides immunogenum]